MNKPRAWLALLAGLVLVCPLLWAIGLMAPRHPTEVEAVTSRLRVVPKLSEGERRRLALYRRECQSEVECALPLTCLMDWWYGRPYCTDSTCMSDADCEEDFACRPFKSVDGTALIHMCTLAGERKEGESCQRMSDTKQTACERGLRCLGWCARPCNVEAPQSCPEGFSCEEHDEGALCRPACESNTCPEGEDCVKRGKQVTFCAHVEGQDCQQNPCPEGQKCITHVRVEEPRSVVMFCAARCGPKENTCPEGDFCVGGLCHRLCASEEPSTCNPGNECIRLDSKAPWLCPANR